MRGDGQNYEWKQRRKSVLRALAIAVVAVGATMTSGCAHIEGMFNPPEPAPKSVVRQPASKPVLNVTPERREEAKALHAAALGQMGRGAFGPATTNLTQAAKLDPTNEQIRRDLARANRVRSAVGAGEPPMRPSSVE